jgi:hypothetical protein
MSYPHVSAAIDVTRHGVAINPSLLVPRVLLAGYLAAAGRDAEAAEIREAVLREDPAFSVRRLVRSFAGVAPGLAGGSPRP